jgi:hypothetical protein
MKIKYLLKRILEEQIHQTKCAERCADEDRMRMIALVEKEAGE